MIKNSKKYILARKFSIIMALVFDFIIMSPFIAFSVSSSRNLYQLYIYIPLSIIVPVILYLFFMRKYRHRIRVVKTDFPADWERILKEKVPYYNALDSDDQERFKRQVQVFINEKDIMGIGTSIDDELRVVVASNAIIPVFSFPDWEYNRLNEVLIYPGSFNEDFDHTQKHNNILGMVGIGSTMILSKPAIYSSVRNPDSTHNVGIHEFAHKIDEKDGLIDGVPAVLMPPKVQKQWIDVMKRETKLIRELKSDISAYATKNEAEFFAVVSEYFFSNPAKLQKGHPELYSLLSKIYRQDTKSMYSNVISTMVSPIGRRNDFNPKCPCGSGKRLKECCLK